MNLWTKEEIYKILMQLDRMKLPFKNYSFVQENGKLKLLGSGGSADVYEARGINIVFPLGESLLRKKTH